MSSGPRGWEERGPVEAEPEQSPLHGAKGAEQDRLLPCRGGGSTQRHRPHEDVAQKQEQS